MTTTNFNEKLAQQLRSRWKLRLWMLRRLPMGLISGMYIASLREEGCEVILKERWWIRNPFGSVFWAVMGMAAELSTGALLYAHLSGSGIRFILVGAEAKFLKKAKGKSSYFCQTGSHLETAIQSLLDTDEGSVLSLPVLARDEQGQILAEFVFRWQLGKPM